MPTGRVYVETTIASYLAARPTRDIVAAARQELTHEWWQTRRQAFDLFISQVVINEASLGDADAAARRLAYFEGLPLLDISGEVEEVAADLLRAGAMPTRAANDALHLAAAGVHGVDYLLTWNFRHLANAELAGAYREVFIARGYEPPMICTPEELMGDPNEDEL